MSPDARNFGDGTAPVGDPTHVWLAYYGDWSAMAVFQREIDCLRYAVGRRMEVARVELGVNLREAVR